MKLTSIGEDALVRRLTKDLPLGDHVVAGAGDDCAVLRPGAGRGQLQLFKTDCIVEGVHFHPDADPEKVGWKAIARTISDIAAMGGLPTDAVVTVVLPPDRPVAYVEGIYAGIRKGADVYGISIVGGETSRSPKSARDGGGAVISIAMLGRVEAKFCTLRSGGKEGDGIFVTGRLGGSLRGRHLTFMPRVAEARWLVGHFRVSAMMDLSDGLGQDLPRLARASGLGYRLESGAIPCHEGCDEQRAICDGEDYELLFALTPRREKALFAAWATEFPDLALTRIGTLTAPDPLGNRPSSGGWDHFG